MKRAVIISTVVVLAAAGAGLWVFGRPAYRTYRETTAAARAVRFLTDLRYNEARLSASQALAYNPSNLQACLVMARLTELAQAPQLLDWRRRIAQIAPSLENRLAVAAAAMQTQSPPFPMARQTLEELAPMATNSAGYHAVAAQLALRLDRSEEAAAHFEEACRIQPQNEQLRLNLAVLRLSATNATVVEAARQTLERLRSSTNVGALSLRWLVVDHVRRRDFQAAEQLSGELLDSSGCTFEDRLQHLTILQATQAPLFSSSLAAVQARAGTNTAAIQLTAAWMISHALAEEAAQWLSNCPPALRAEQPVARALAECYIATKNWEGLEDFLHGEQWGEADFLRYAFLSLAADRQKQSLGADTRWRSAIREAGERLGPLMLLLRLSTAWDRREATEELLWKIVQRFPKERWALGELERAYVQSGNTRGLYRVYNAMVAYDSGNFVIRNNIASTALLLGVDLARAHELAQAVFREQPGNPTVLSTYAFSLQLQGKTSRALELMQQVEPEALGRHPVSLYYGLLLAAAGQHEQARTYLELSRSADLLPEERSLLVAAAGATN